MRTAYQFLYNSFSIYYGTYRYSLAAALSCLLLCASACSRKDEPLPVAATTSVLPATSAGAKAKAKAWFAGLKSATTNLKCTTASRTAGDTPPAIDWERTIYSEEYIVAPFADTDNPFAVSQHYGYRFLVVRTTGDSCAGRIVELITRQPTTSKEAAYSVLAGTKPFLTNQLPGAVADFTGTLLVYSPRYQYEAGLAYASGALQPLRMAPGPVGPDTCYDYYLVGYDNTGVQVIHDFLYSSCTGGIPGAGGGWGGGGGNTTGGGGGGGGGMLSPSTVLVAPPTTPVVNVQQYLKCFITTQGASLTVYVAQPVPGTANTWAGNIRRPDVGHTFISITQNGITRVIGFYPTSPAAAIHAVPGVAGDDSGHGYNVSITTNISANELSSMLNYVYSNEGAMYGLQNYNCTNFGIGACAQAGLFLPNTPGKWGMFFGGSNPGNLGEDMRTMTLPAGSTRNVAGGTAPTNAGGC